MGERHHRYVWYDGSSKQSGKGQASISHFAETSGQRHRDEDMLREERSIMNMMMMMLHLPAVNVLR